MTLVRYAILVAVLAIGCSSNKIVITQSRASAPGPFETLDVFVNLPANGNRGIYYGLKKTLAAELAACAVTPSIVAGAPVDGEARDPSSTATARLIVGWGSGQLTTVTTVGPYGNVVDDKAFKDLDMDLWFELRDFTLERVTWLAFAKLHVESSGNVVGEDLAHALVARLRADGVLQRCR